MRVSQRAPGLGRRSFLRGGITTAGAAALPFLFARKVRALPLGPLVSDPAGRLDLPEGFSYEILDRQGELMSDGYRVPGNPDGMACFPGPNGTLVLLRNHELTSSRRGPYLLLQPAPPEAYDADFAGGVTRLVLDATTKARVSSNLVLTGTVQNCSGGPSPWGWLSCEETFSASHGYVFICSPDAASVRPPERILGYGHYRHEAVAIDPSTNIAYLTEDRPDSVLFRFVPDDPRSPFVGKLQALGVPGEPYFTTSVGLAVGDELDVFWVDIANPDPFHDNLRYETRQNGAAVVSRGEGIWFHDGVVYFTATDGGPARSGQVFALRPTRTGGKLSLIAQSEDPAVLDGPDNITMAPWGDLVIAEDGFTSNDNYLRCLTPDGTLYDLARTRLSELSGVCFAPDGRALFLNLFGADLTLVIQGPFPASDPGGAGGGGEGGAAGAPDEGGRGTGAGGSGSGGTTPAGVSTARVDSRDDPGCGCEIPGKRL